MDGVKIIRIGDLEYPRALLDLKNPPKQLYVKGNLQLLTRPMVSIVGTRDCTRYGTMIAKELGEKCAAAKICVVSGLAEGIDAAAHTGAMGCTIAVLGNGLDCYYPACNKDLQNEIATTGGLLISEYPLGVHGDRTTFPQRNRIVAALSRAVVAVEADKKSGTLITVGVAKELHREIFSVPGNINCYASQGTNNLIANKTARMLTSTDDVVAYYGAAVQDEENKMQTKQVTFEQKIILDIMKTDEVHIDELIEKSGLAVPQLSTLLTNMEMIGLIEKLPGNYFVAK